MYQFLWLLWHAILDVSLSDPGVVHGFATNWSNGIVFVWNKRTPSATSGLLVVVFVATGLVGDPGIRGG